MKLTTFSSIMAIGAAVGLVAATVNPYIWWIPFIACSTAMVFVFALTKIFPKIDE